MAIYYVGEAVHNGKCVYWESNTRSTLYTHPKNNSLTVKENTSPKQALASCLSTYKEHVLDDFGVKTPETEFPEVIQDWLDDLSDEQVIAQSRPLEVNDCLITIEDSDIESLEASLGTRALWSSAP